MNSEARLTVVCDAGTTASRVGLYGADGTFIAETVGPPANPIEYGIGHCTRTLAALARSIAKERISILAAAVSGAANRVVRTEMARQLSRLTEADCVMVTSDLHPILAANVGDRPGILAIAGTGSSVLAFDGKGGWRISGGRGGVFGEDGSGYAIAVTALRAAADAVDGIGPETTLADQLPRAAGLRAFGDLTAWVASANKREIADLTRTVVRMAESDDAVARRCVENEARALAQRVLGLAQTMRLPAGTPVCMHGAIVRSIPAYRAVFESALQPAGIVPSFPQVSGHRAVYEMTRLPGALPDWITAARYEPDGGALPVTELRPETAPPLDTLPAAGIVHRMCREDAEVPPAVKAVSEELAVCVASAAESIRNGGRLIYVGAGTSGRLGVLDASECHPTFGIERGRVIGIIAGGHRAMNESVEGAEDDTDAAAADMAAIVPKMNDRDFVVGISASGMTPYVNAALSFAKSAGAKTALLCCNPSPPINADIVVAMDTGPEVLAGSTRLKAGTATKMALNIISTGAFALSGYVYQGYMVGVQPVNAKLRKRAAGIIAALTPCSLDEAEEFLRKGRNSVSVAVLMARMKLSPEEAAARLKTKGSLRAALDEE